MAAALISAGSNLGDSLTTLRQAVAESAQQAGEVTACSAVYRTRPWGFTAQPDFLNAAFALETNLPPDELLAVLQRIELTHGRERLQHWGPRTLDLDIIDYAGVTADSQRLTLPHPRALQRAFVLLPLDEIVPDYIFTGTQLSVHAAACALTQAERSEVIKTNGRLMCS